MNATLLSVELVLLHQEGGAALQDLGPTIADFLGPKRLLSLHEACTVGSLKLLDWVWRASREAASHGKNAGWTLTNYLQTDRHYYQWQFSEALEVAAGRGDLDVVQWLFAHFPNCQVTVEVVEAAAMNGRLGVLRFLLDHDTGRMEKEGGAASHSVRWGGRSLVNAVENGHSQVVRWLCENGIHGCGEAQMASAIKTALRVGDMPLAEFLLPRGKCILDYAEFCSHPDVIEWKLDCGYFNRDAFGAGVAIKCLVRSGRLDLMQRIAALHHPPPEHSDWPTDWRCAMVHACVYGDKAILQWLMEHPAGRWTCDGDDRLFSELVFSAAYTGNVDVMAYLYERGAVDKVRDALLHGVREGHFALVKWLIEHFPGSERLPDYCVMDEAARFGRLEMLEYFEELEASAVPGYFPMLQSLTQRGARNSRGEKFMSQVFVPASDDYLKVHPTLCRYRSEWQPTEAMDDAAANGHLGVVEWLHFNRSEGCTTAAMDCAASNGHLEVVEWLQEHRAEGCTTKAMDGAAENGHLEVVKWLYSNRIEGCTLKAIEGALGNGHLQVAAWLNVHLPALKPANVELWRRPPDLFELLLFQEFHFSSSFSPSLVEYAREILLDSSSKSSHVHIVEWLQEKFPSAPGAQDDEQW